MDAGPAIFDVLVDVRAVLAGDRQEHILGRDARAQFAGELVADRLADAEPGAPGGNGEQRLRQAHAARGAVEGAAAAGMAVGIDQHGAGQRIGVVGNDDMADALVVADVVEALDAEAGDELARAPVRRRGLGVVRRRQVVEHDDDPVGIVELQDFAPARGQEVHVEKNGGADRHDGDLAGRDGFRPARLRQDFFRHRHTHGRLPRAA